MLLDTQTCMKSKAKKKLFSSKDKNEKYLAIVVVSCCVDWSNIGQY